MTGDKMNKLKVTQIRSIIDRSKKQKLTIEALGLGRPNYSNILPDNPQTRGMLEVVKHLVKVEQVAN
ncbi:MAG: 50S ribosomal protein L30 [Ignavibacteria bacterium GWB2_35_12]|nr:MAG: 50S ribosomal protein L30 [Ignavibacteria bacterium GWA2_35_8]OGU39776.1 MAG: 50S ribosomal protein L30 [Ignavibacteria bacterium GWB2_35_12]OGU95547.1 MAG: 50S ribosomal protein L30 [Ignavibacteria bacterium RIFOXYA2_FULL_35_10]OGV21333.1 MAG: 50S ribosomal protein L30 [Ignavibacteria bacterium RIFOXYC2_FULL_35_21]